jgi:hypothetical protein
MVHFRAAVVQVQRMHPRVECLAHPGAATVWRRAALPRAERTTERRP